MNRAQHSYSLRIRHSYFFDNCFLDWIADLSSIRYSDCVVYSSGRQFMALDLNPDQIQTVLRVCTHIAIPFDQPDFFRRFVIERMRSINPDLALTLMALSDEEYARVMRDAAIAQRCGA